MHPSLLPQKTLGAGRTVLPFTKELAIATVAIALKKTNTRLLESAINAISGALIETSRLARAQEGFSAAAVETAFRLELDKAVDGIAEGRAEAGADNIKPMQLIAAEFSARRDALSERMDRVRVAAVHHAGVLLKQVLWAVAELRESTEQAELAAHHDFGLGAEFRGSGPLFALAAVEQRLETIDEAGGNLASGPFNTLFLFLPRELFVSD